MTHTLTINGQVHKTDVDGEMPLLWFLRDTLELTGTKYGCGMGLCGSCTVHLNGEAGRQDDIAQIHIGFRPGRRQEQTQGQQ